MIANGSRVRILLPEDCEYAGREGTLVDYAPWENDEDDRKEEVCFIKFDGKVGFIHVRRKHLEEVI